MNREPTTKSARRIEIGCFLNQYDKSRIIYNSNIFIIAMQNKLDKVKNTVT